jgi:hypothetical protein
MIASGQVTFETSPDASQWQTELPTEPNTCWYFYGYPHGKRDFDKGPALSFVSIWQAGDPAKPFLTYIADGQFMYPKDDKCVGRWIKVIIQPLPLLPDNFGE